MVTNRSISDKLAVTEYNSVVPTNPWGFQVKLMIVCCKCNLGGDSYNAHKNQ